jgi:hypothetical protein
MNKTNTNFRPGLFTASGKDPAYITVEDALWGVVTNQAGEIAETRATAFSTDLGASISWNALDMDPCTGNIQERQIALSATNGAGILPEGRVRYRLAKIAINNPTRQVVFRLTRPTTTTTNNITAGQFIQPMFDYTFPELLAIGNPMLPNAFEVMPFLALGQGPFQPGKPGSSPPATPVIVGQLNPWPNLPTPASTQCPPPSSNAPAPVTSPVQTITPAGGGPVPDTVTISSATGKNQRGVATVVINASTNNSGATLTVSLAGANPIKDAPMTNLGNGQWTFTIQVKSKPTTCTVVSNKGGSATAPVV